MRECTVCGETDFEELDGLFFCTTCNTQSQDVRVMVAEDEALENFQWSSIIREPTAPKEKPKKVRDEGRPWSLYEAYQIIIRHQIEALIKLGAHEDLREVVFQLWANYLSRLGIAFSCTKDAELTKYERQREMFPGTTEKPKIKNVLGRRSRLRSQGMSAKKARQQMERDQTKVALQNEEFYEGDNPLQAESQAEEDREKEEWDSSEEDEEEERWGRYRKKLRYDTVKRIRMVSTLGICFLGLMYTNPITTATDLLRWVQSGRIPYLDVSKIVPDDMKFHMNDWKYFGQGQMPSHEQLRFAVGSIGHFLGLTNLPEFPLDELIHKYIIQLDLPAEFHGFVMNLRKNMDICLKYIPTATQKTLCNWEGIAMAYIVIMLKSLFALDDSTEVTLSKCSQELMEICHTPRPLFVWIDWVEHMKNKMMLQQDRSGYKAVTERLKKWTSNRHYISNNRLYNPAIRESLARPFRELAARWGLPEVSLTDDEADNHGSTSPVIDLDFLMEEDPMDTLQNEVGTLQNGKSGENTAHSLNQRQSEILKEIKERGESFRQCSVQHIVSPETFLYDLHKRSVTDQTRSSSVDEFDLSEVIKDDSFVREARAVQQRTSELESELDMNKVVTQSSNMAKYQDIVQTLSDIKENFQISLEFENKSICLNYDWLIKICSHCIDCEPKDLKMEICKLEIMFFSEERDPGLSKKGHYLRGQLRKYGTVFLGRKLNLDEL